MILSAPESSAKGYCIQYEPEALHGVASFSLVDEQKRKVRIAAGGFSIGLLTPAAFWNTQLSFLYISHRVLDGR